MYIPVFLFPRWFVTRASQPIPPPAERRNERKDESSSLRGERVTQKKERERDPLPLEQDRSRGMESG